MPGKAAGEKMGGADNNIKAQMELLPEYKKLYDENQDMVGWIQILGTHINYPVMQTPKETESYLHRDFYGKASYAGPPFVGSGSLKNRNDDIFIYAHNMRNGSMFADLLKYRDPTYWRKHPAILNWILYGSTENMKSLQYFMLVKRIGNQKTDCCIHFAGR